MKYQNFTQFCAEHGYPSDYSTMFEAQLLGSRGLAGRISQRQIKSGDERFHKMLSDNAKAKSMFINAVLSGDIIDTSGEYVKETMLARQAREDAEQKKSDIQIIKGKIAFIESLGSMSHNKNGKLKKGYREQVDELKEQLKAIS